MSIDYIVNESDMLSVANSIREKAGISDSLAFPAGFAEAIAAIEAGENIATGTFTTNDITSNIEISHGLGKLPKSFCVYNCEGQGFIIQTTPVWLRFIYGAFLSNIGLYYVMYTKVGYSQLGGGNENLDFAATGTSGSFASYVNVSAEKIIIKQKGFSSTYGIGLGNTFRWFAI